MSKLRILLLVFCLIAYFVNAQEESEDTKKHEAFEKCLRLQKYAIKWFQNQDECFKELNKNINTDDKEEQISLDFTEATLLGLGGQPSNAIKTLNKLIKENGKSEYKDSIVEIFANFWIATMSRNFGNYRMAMTAYDNVMNNEKSDDFDKMLCYIRKAEIKDFILNDKNGAVKELELAEKFKVSQEGMTGELCKVLKMYINYQKILYSQGKKKAQKIIDSKRIKIDELFYLPICMAEISGIGSDPWVTFYRDEGQIILEAALTMGKENISSPLDKYISLFYLGILREDQKKYPEAEEMYKELFESDSFFAVLGGIKLVLCQRKEGKTEDANKTLEKAKGIFPGYKPILDEISKNKKFSLKF